MQIIDEKSLIKKYQNEIRSLKEELDQLKRGIVVPRLTNKGEDDIVLLKQKVWLWWVSLVVCTWAGCILLWFNFFISQVLLMWKLFA